MILIRPWIPVFRWDTGTTYIISESDDCPFAVSHIVTHYYAASHWVGYMVFRSFCRSVSLSALQKRLKGSSCHLFRTWVGPVNHVLNEVQMPIREEVILRGNRQTIVKYRYNPRSSVQRRLNRSRCPLGCGLAWAESIMCYMERPDPPWEGAILVDRSAHYKV